MKKYRICSLLFFLCCLLFVISGNAANYIRLYNPNTKSPLLELPLEKRLELAKRYAETGYYWLNPLVEVLGAETGKWGLVDFAGNEVTPCKYDSIYDFHEGYAKVKLNDKYGFLDKDGKEVVPCKYDLSYLFKDGLATVCINGKWGVINGDGEEVVACIYDGGLHFSEGVAAAHVGGWENGKFGYIDREGNEVISFLYDGAFAFNAQPLSAGEQLNPMKLMPSPV